MKKLLILLPVLLLSFTLFCQTLTYSSLKIVHWPNLYDTAYQEIAVNMRIELTPDSVMTVYNLDSLTNLKIKVYEVVKQGPTSKGNFMAKSFNSKNLSSPYEKLTLTLFYNKNDLSLDSIGISDGKDLIVLLITYKEKEL